MSDKSRFITLGVVVLVFLAANIIAGIYKWGAPRETPVRQEMTEESAEDIGKLEKQQSKPVVSNPIWFMFIMLPVSGSGV